MFIFSSTFTFYVTAIAIPFGFAMAVTTAVTFVSLVQLQLNSPERLISFSRIKINRTRSEFEKVAFRRSVSVWNKQKIELISSTSDKAGFFCFTWFRLSSFVFLQVRRIRLRLISLEIQLCFLPRPLLSRLSTSFFSSSFTIWANGRSAKRVCSLNEFSIQIMFTLGLKHLKSLIC